MSLHGLPKAAREIEFHPAAAQVVGLAGDLVADDGDGQAEGDGVVLPIAGMFLDAGHQLARSEVGAGGEFDAFRGIGAHQLDVAAADIDDEDDFRNLGRRGFARGHSAIFQNVLNRRSRSTTINAVRRRFRGNRRTRLL